MPKLSREGESAPLTLGQSLAADICPRSTMVRAPRGVFNRGPQSGRVGSKEGPYAPRPLKRKIRARRGSLRPCRATRKPRVRRRVKQHVPYSVRRYATTAAPAAPPTRSRRRCTRCALPFKLAEVEGYGIAAGLRARADRACAAGVSMRHRTANPTASRGSARWRF